MFRLNKIRSGWLELMGVFSWDIGVDLGSNNTLIYLKGRGVVIDEPTMIARIKRKRWTGLTAPKSRDLKPIAYGFKAKEMFLREPQQVEVISPIKNGIIYDLEATESLVSYYLKLVYEIPSSPPKILKPRVVVGVPARVTEVQKRAVRSVFMAAGAREVVLIEEAVLAGLSVGMPLARSSALMLVNIGGGKTEVVVVSMGGVVVGRWIKTAGNDFDLAIINYVKMKYGLLIGQRSAERVKMEKEIASLRGRDLESGLPKSVRINQSEVTEAVALEMNKIIKLVAEVLDETPPELMDDVIKKGIVLLGNGAKFEGIDRLIEKETKINTRLVEDPGLAVIKGIGMLLEDNELMGAIKVMGGRC